MTDRTFKSLLLLSALLVGASIGLSDRVPPVTYWLLIASVVVILAVLLLDTWRKWKRQQCLRYHRVLWDNEGARVRCLDCESDLDVQTQ